jgi:hypothetical protein
MLCLNLSYASFGAQINVNENHVALSEYEF